MAELVRLVDADNVDDFATIFGHDVKKVEDQPGGRAMDLDLQFIGDRHVDRHDLGLLDNACEQLFQECLGDLG